jgi:hypothetical protein
MKGELGVTHQTTTNNKPITYRQSEKGERTNHISSLLYSKKPIVKLTSHEPINTYENRSVPSPYVVPVEIVFDVSFKKVDRPGLVVTSSVVY